MTIAHLEQLWNTFLQVSDYKDADNSLNGLQLGDREKPVRKVAFAVDACMESFRRAVDWGANVLVVHHGLFWGQVESLTGLRFDRLNYLFNNDLALYAAHLPLDAHPLLGNNVGLARELNLYNVESFGNYHGKKIGIRGQLSRPMRLEEISEKLFGDDRGLLGKLPFGKDLNECVGIISGGAAFEVLQAIDEKLDVYISGESSHTVYHYCQEAKINVLFGGHYRTEVWGVANLAKWTKEQTGIETCFLDIPTGY